ncbi:hypothetical protein E3J48_02555 [Candidatus Aerophobetes bacterium]|uniref:Uncharacterized protein n=1 Tax=Aerophobetes bacterium TaxID=2030807 RepID=A0A523W8M6_UNCAE|nr:MAG: hypothetical protein E3J48_02555 [Candidatus Aerophobetes bacterium]
MDPLATKPDVNKDPVPSADPGVAAGSPPAKDVKPPVSSPGEPQPPAEPQPPVEPPHEENVPYARLKEALDKNKELQAAIDAAVGPKEPVAPAAPGPQVPIDFASLGLAPPEPQPQAPLQPGAPSPLSAPIMTPDEIEQRIRDDMYNKPYATFAPIIIELAKQVYQDQRKSDAQVRSMPGFQQVESSYYSIPDDVVQQAQSNPEVIRYLIAMNARNVAGQPATAPSIPLPNQQTLPVPDPNNPPKTMEELKQQYIAEGERLAVDKLRNQQGLQSEGAGSIPSPSGDEPELDESQKVFMRRLGIKDEKFKSVATRLQSSVGGEKK